MRKKITCVVILAVITSLLLTTTAMADFEEEPELKLWSYNEIMEETKTESSYEEVQDIILDIGHKNAVDRDLVWWYFAEGGEKVDVFDLEENDVTDEVDDLAAEVGDVAELKGVDVEEIDSFMDEFVELDEVEDITDDIVQEIEK